MTLLQQYPRIPPETAITLNQQDSYIIHLGYFGDFLQGSVGIVVSLLVLTTVFYTFFIEKNRVEKQRFEDRFYHLLHMHRSNVNSMAIDFDGIKHENSKAILSIFRELEVIVKIFKLKMKLETKNIFLLDNFSNRDKGLILIVLNNWKGSFVLDESFEEDSLYEISFLIMFLGCGERSRKILKNYLSKYNSSLNIDEIIKVFSDENFRCLVKDNQNFQYKLFGGHQSRLGHYYRNMFHIVKFIDSSTHLNFNEKLSYIKNFRVQLNTFEQALLFVNSKTIFGQEWSKYIIKYKLVKNIPKDFFGKNYWFYIEDEIKKLAKDNDRVIKKEYKKDVESFMQTYFEFNKHGL